MCYYLYFCVTFITGYFWVPPRFQGLHVGKERGPHKTTYTNIYYSIPLWYEKEVDSLEKRPDTHTNLLLKKNVIYASKKIFYKLNYRHQTTNLVRWPEFFFDFIHTGWDGFELQQIDTEEETAHRTGAVSHLFNEGLHDFKTANISSSIWEIWWALYSIFPDSIPINS